jgi:hypothetical protein
MSIIRALIGVFRLRFDLRERITISIVVATRFPCRRLLVLERRPKQLAEAAGPSSNTLGWIARLICFEGCVLVEDFRRD